MRSAYIIVSANRSGGSNRKTLACDKRGNIGKKRGGGPENQEERREER
jgi:hypothetical protein